MLASLLLVREVLIQALHHSVLHLKVWYNASLSHKFLSDCKQHVIAAFFLEFTLRNDKVGNEFLISQHLCSSFVQDACTFCANGLWHCGGR